MRSHYKRIGDYVTQIKQKNTDGLVSDLKGININKYFMPSVANTNGTDLKKYRVVAKKQFAFNPMHVGRDEILPIAMLETDDPIIVSPAYVVFGVKDEEQLLPEYLMLWCRRSEFDRNAWFMTDNSVRGGFSWSDFCDMEFPVPHIEKQREIVREYDIVNDRIALNNQFIQELEDTVQTIYKRWFVDFEFPISKKYANSIGRPEIEGMPYKSTGGRMAYSTQYGKDLPLGWQLYELENLVERVCVGFVGTLHSSYCKEEEGVRLLRTTDLSELGMQYAENKFVLPEFHHKNIKSQLNYGDILVARHGSNGMPVIYDRTDESNCLNVIIVKPASERMPSKVVQTFMKSNSAMEQVRVSLRGSVQSVLNTKIVASMKLPYFPHDAVNYVDLSPFSKIQQHIESIRKESELLNKFRLLLFTKISKA
ncbi:hypothetical protein [Aliamphritea ceti]|uniref:hypothetical protein n=1 Tax=Aliamphritea ceti TaxID=1524258 RepID=UPI0021C34924|nr:hypothetical protein [Aliamphritea ceti]